MSFEFEITHDTDMTLSARIIDYEPHRDPPACSNPDSPRFSDCGDSGYIEFDLFFLIEKTKREKNSSGEWETKNIKIEVSVPDEIYDYFEDEIYELLSKKAGQAFYEYCEEERTNRMIEQAEHRKDIHFDDLYNF